MRTARPLRPRPLGAPGRRRRRIARAEGRRPDRAGRRQLLGNRGRSLPASATHARPALAGAPFTAIGVSVVLHPKNPHVPTTHLNLRYFIAEPAGSAPGLVVRRRLRPDAVLSGARGRAATGTAPRAAPATASRAPTTRYKAWCDRYFYLPHRNETRGVGGLFFDDLNERGFEACFRVRARRRRGLSAGLAADRGAAPATRRSASASARSSCCRRGRYVEFNLIHDRGTLFGLQTGGRTESILMSLPPLARWEYGYAPEPGSAEEALTREWLRPRDWLGEA